MATRTVATDTRIGRVRMKATYFLTDFFQTGITIIVTQ